MTKALLQVIRSEFEHTQPDMSKNEHLRQLCDKYSCSKKDLKGYTTWEKGFRPDSKIRLIYETIYSPDVVDYLEEPMEEAIEQTANKILSGEIVTNPGNNKQVKDGFEGLRLLDIKLQSQALSLLSAIESKLEDIETAKDVRDLVAAHTAIRDSYFNTQAPMINIINGNVDNSTTNELQVLLENIEDDC